jgi:signal peptidase I
MERRRNGGGTEKERRCCIIYPDAGNGPRGTSTLQEKTLFRQTKKRKEMEQAMHQETQIQERESQEKEVLEPAAQEAPPQEAEPCEEQPQEPETQDTREQKKTVLRFFLKLAAVLLVVWAIFTFVFGIRQVDGESMYPRLRDGDLILYYRLEQDYQIGDVVAFRVDGKKVQARIVAQGGDVVEVTAEGQLLVNSHLQQEEIFYLTEPQEGDISYPYTVEADSYFLLCDFRTSGADSRTFGTISQKDLDGKVITVLRRRGI